MVNQVETVGIRGVISQKNSRKQKRTLFFRETEWMNYDEKKKKYYDMVMKNTKK